MQYSHIYLSAVSLFKQLYIFFCALPNLSIYIPSSSISLTIQFIIIIKHFNTKRKDLSEFYIQPSPSYPCLCTTHSDYKYKMVGQNYVSDYFATKTKTKKSISFNFFDHKIQGIIIIMYPTGYIFSP